ncbi:MAG: hypothetical protein JWO09_2551 [Bacteroidetes bacterium]|nr:hypothetical protein [Bacteroidota bacterium]
MKKVSTILALLLAGSAFAQLTSYDYNRKLGAVAKEDFYSIPLSPEITAHSRSGLNDLRIYNISGSDTAEVPYLLEYQGDKTEETPIDFELINDVSHLKCCSFVTLKMSKSKVINTIQLDVLQNNFDKILSIEGSNDNREWFTIRQHLRIVGFDNGGVSFRSTSVSFPSAEYSYFRIRFDDDSSEKIEVTKAYAFESTTSKGQYDELAIKNKQQTENKKEKTSELVLELPDNYMLSYLSLESSSKSDFYRNINIYRSAGTYHTPKGDQENWQMVNSGVIISGEKNTFTLGNEQSKKIKIEAINYDNQPVSLDEVKVFSEKVALTAKLPAGGSLYLAYGKENAAAPVYDLVHFKDKIPAALNVVTPGKEEQKVSPMLNASAEPLIRNKMWLWVVMGLVIVLIGYFALSMLKKEK